MEIDEVIFEYRPNLSTISCFVRFCDEISNSVKLIIEPTGIRIKKSKNDSVHIKTDHVFSIKNSSLFNFTVGNKFISFSFLNEKSTSQEFLAPHVTIPKPDNFSVSRLKCNINNKVACSNCRTNLLIAETAMFHRILELPMQFEMEDMFCHLHSHEDDEDVVEDQSLEMVNDKYCHNDHGSGESVAHKFQPGMTDIFYGTFYILMNNSLFNKNSIKQDGQNAHCKKCLHLIGQVSLNQKSLKIWTENIRFSDEFFYPVSSPIHMVTDAIKRIIFSYHIVPSIPVVKIMLECVVPKTNRKHHILLAVMEKNLVVLRQLEFDYKLRSTNALKVMYCACQFQQTPGTKDRDEMLKSWSKDLCVNTFEISFELFNSFCNHLNKNSALIPHVYRTSGLFTFSYIDLF